MGRGGRAGAPRDPPCQRSMGKGAQGSSAKVPPRPPLPQLEPSWSPPPTRRHRGQGKPPGPGATLPCAPGQGGVTPPHSPPSRLFIAVLGRGCCLGRPARGQPLCPACMPFISPPLLPRQELPNLEREGLRKGGGGQGWGCVRSTEWLRWVSSGATGHLLIIWGALLGSSTSIHLIEM